MKLKFHTCFPFVFVVAIVINPKLFMKFCGLADSKCTVFSLLKGNFSKQLVGSPGQVLRWTFLFALIGH